MLEFLFKGTQEEIKRLVIQLASYKALQYGPFSAPSVSTLTAPLSYTGPPPHASPILHAGSPLIPCALFCLLRISLSPWTCAWLISLLYLILFTLSSQRFSAHPQTHPHIPLLYCSSKPLLPYNFYICFSFFSILLFCLLLLECEHYEDSDFSVLFHFWKCSTYKDSIYDMHRLLTKNYHILSNDLFFNHPNTEDDRKWGWFGNEDSICGVCVCVFNWWYVCVFNRPVFT